MQDQKKTFGVFCRCKKHMQNWSQVCWMLILSYKSRTLFSYRLYYLIDVFWLKLLYTYICRLRLKSFAEVCWAKMQNSLTKRISHPLVSKFQMSQTIIPRKEVVSCDYWLYINIQNFWKKLSGGNILFISCCFAGWSLTSNNIMPEKLSDPPNT